MSRPDAWSPDLKKRERVQAVIWEILDRRARGRENAITRDELLTHAKTFIPTLNDRELRDAYAHLAVVSCDEGIFIPTKPADLMAFKDYLTVKARPLYERFNRVRLSYPELVPQGEDGQMDLFGGAS